MGCDDDGLARESAGANDFALDDGELAEIDLDAQISARDHDAVGRF